MRLIRYVLNNDWIIPGLCGIGIMVGLGMLIRDVTAQAREDRAWRWVCPTGHIPLPATDGVTYCVPGVLPTRVPAR